jgi:thiol-disulfide isomerase/thioredoxin
MRVVALRDRFFARLAALVAVTGLLVGCGENERSRGRFVGGAPPAFATAETTWVNAQPMTWGELRGKVVLVEFGFIDCPACQKMTDNLAAWHRSYAEKGLTVLYVEEGRATTLPTLRERVATDGTPYPIVHDGVGATAQSFGVKAYPLAFVINRAGKVIWEGVPVRNPAAVELAIKNALAN